MLVQKKNYTSDTNDKLSKSEKAKVVKKDVEQDLQDAQSRSALRKILTETSDAQHEVACLSLEALTTFLNNQNVINLVSYDNKDKKAVFINQENTVSSGVLMYAVKKNILNFYGASVNGSTKNSISKNQNIDYANFWTNDESKGLKKESLEKTFKNVLTVYLWATKNKSLVDRNGKESNTIVLADNTVKDKFCISNRQDDKHYNKSAGSALVVSFTKALSIAGQSVISSQSGEEKDRIEKACSLIQDFCTDHEIGARIPDKIETGLIATAQVIMHTAPELFGPIATEVKLIEKMMKEEKQNETNKKNKEDLAQSK